MKFMIIEEVSNNRLAMGLTKTMGSGEGVKVLWCSMFPF
jgi:hypothetical protein